MKKNIANKWVKALRSKKYKQGQDCLCQTIVDNKGKTIGKAHCCLGVLCDLYNEEHTGKDQLKVRCDEDGIYFYNRNDEVLPKKVMEWAGLKSKYGEFTEGCRLKKKFHGCESLSELNDGGASFRTIANFIEKNYEKLW